MSQQKKSKNESDNLAEFSLIIKGHLNSIYGTDDKINQKALNMIVKTVREIETEAAIIRGELLRDLLRRHIDNAILQEFLDIITGIKIL